MLILALDTTSRPGSAAVVDNDEVLSEIVGDASQTHAERLPHDLMRALDAARVPLDSIDLLAVAAGPGSFTGLRVGIAAMQGLAMSTGRTIVPVSALDAVATAGADGAGLVGAWIDAQRGEVFAALYDRESHALELPTALSPVATLEAWKSSMAGGRVRFIGNGAARYEAVIHAQLGARAHVLPTPPLAGVIGKLAARAPASARLPHAVVPIYVRRPDVELARSRRGS